jgi:predicted ATPase/DNA-binding CsgD family transcriptional regulator
MGGVTDQRTLADAGVSAREAEVLALVGDHLTNAEIGARLYISVRTVESHVSSLLRKLDLPDRRSLAALAPPAVVRRAPGRSSAPLPAPLTSFVGRETERAALAAALHEHRLVTALGPGGVGKTRLALAVAADVVERFVDGAWYVDLVPVTDGAMVAAAVAATFGVGEQLGRSAEQTVIGRLADTEALLVLDNCEHLTEGVAVFVERVLSSCPGVVVLATSRARLVVPFEWVFPVPGLSLPGEDGDGDAVALFLQRASAVGRVTADGDEWQRLVAICTALDGMALAIELAAARLPTLGFDGLEAGLEDRIRVLAGGARADDRHRSLRDMLDWSYALLDGVDQAVLRRVAVFAAPFDPAAAADVAGPREPGAIAAALARLVDHSLLVTVGGPGGTRYRALETIRQYGAEQLVSAGESDAVRGRHLDWCVATARRLAAVPGDDLGPWRSAFDAAGDDLRAGLTWASVAPGHRAEAHELALLLAALVFQRGMPGEAQRRYEQAASRAPTERDAAEALRLAAGAAEGHQVGVDDLRLYRAAADAALRAGDGPGAAVKLARAAELVNRCPGIMAELPPAGAAEAYLLEAQILAGGDPRAHAAIVVAEAFNGKDVDALTAELAERAVELAQRVDDPLLHSSALDALTSSQLTHGDIVPAAASARRRLDVLDATPVDARSILEVTDAYAMTAETSVGAGDLVPARRAAERLRDLPCLREEPHLATTRLLVVDALMGDFDRVLAESARFREGWERSGRPIAGNLGIGAYAVAAVHGLRGDEAARAEWLAIVAFLRTTVDGQQGLRTGYAPTLDAIVLLHRGEAAAAMEALAVAPELLRHWHTSLWRQWYAALWAEAAVLAYHAEAPARLARARFLVGGNALATALVDRATALASGDVGGLRRAAGALRAAGSRYQWARTLMLAGGEDGAQGREALSAMGVEPR